MTAAPRQQKSPSHGRQRRQRQSLRLAVALMGTCPATAATAAAAAAAVTEGMGHASNALTAAAAAPRRRAVAAPAMGTRASSAGPALHGFAYTCRWQITQSMRCRRATRCPAVPRWRPAAWARRRRCVWHRQRGTCGGWRVDSRQSDCPLTRVLEGTRLQGLNRWVAVRRAIRRQLTAAVSRPSAMRRLSRRCRAVRAPSVCGLRHPLATSGCGSGLWGCCAAARSCTGGCLIAAAVGTAAAAAQGRLQGLGRRLTHMPFVTLWWRRRARLRWRHTRCWASDVTARCICTHT